MGSCIRNTIEIRSPLNIGYSLLSLDFGSVASTQNQTLGLNPKHVLSFSVGKGYVNTMEL